MPGGPVVTLPPGTGAAAVSRVLVVADGDILPHAVRAVRESGTLFEHARVHAIRRLESGRGPLYVTRLGDRDCVVRHARRGGALARLLGDLHARIGTPRPVTELAVSRAIAALGLPTPAVLAVAVYPGPAWFYRGDVATQWIPGSVDLADAVFSGEGEREGTAAGASQIRLDAPIAAFAAGRLVREMHRHRVDHPDLNLKNILLTAGAGEGEGESGVRALLVDLDRVRIRERLSEARTAAMLRRFERSWRKWERATGRPAPAALEVFHAGYAEAPQPHAHRHPSSPAGKQESRR
ncbi:MAG: lipopolysaccharide kinase InaA family protein [Longimicrobiales bacterium]